MSGLMSGYGVCGWESGWGGMLLCIYWGVEEQAFGFKRMGPQEPSMA